MAKGGKSSGRAPTSFNDAPVTSDPRFAKVHTDPRFLKPKRDDTKVVVDERFKGLFEDDKGGKKKKTDKYGRKIGKGQSDADQMKRFYRLEEDDLDPSKADDDEEDSSDDEDAGPVDYARGEGDLESSSEEESSEDSDDASDDDEESDSESEDEDSEDDDDVMIGPSSVIDREKRKKAARNARFNEEEDDDDDGFGSDIGEIDLDEDVDEAVYAQLDAQAERAIAEGGIEDEVSDSDAEAASSRKKGKGKEKARKTKSKSSKNKIPRGDDTCRLAAVNLDWDHVRAKDIYKVFSSIVSPTAAISAADALQAHRRAAAQTASSSSSRAKAAPAISQVRGKLLHVRVYPSDFGKERMAKEDLEGPPPEIFKGSKNRNDDSDSEDEKEITAKTIVQVDEGGEFDEEALRKYQLDRLRYYYAVATFDSKETARHVYNEIDGTEMERTANVFDLRFVPDGMEFPDGEEGRDAEFRDEATEDAANYKGVDFKTDALRHSRVKLTWDQDDPERSKLTRMVARGGLTKEQLRDDDFKAYLASDTESEPDEDEVAAKNGRDRLRALLNLDGKGDDGSGFGKKGKRNGGVFDDPRHDDDEEQGEMQITFMPGLSEAAAKKAANGAKKAGEDETTLEKYLRKQKEKKERRKAQRSGAADDEDGDKEAEAADGAIGSTDAGFDDPFFNQDMDMEAALAAEFGEDGPTSKPSKKSSKKAASKIAVDADAEDPVEAARQRAHLTTLIGDTNDELTQDGRQHFDMKDILRVESGKDAKRAKMLKRLSKKKQREEQDFQERKGAPLVQDTFEIDAKDDRFSALMDDHRFAIDPTHPGFAKTKAMTKIMDERRKRLDQVDAEGRPMEKQGSAKQDTGKQEDGELSALVEKLKRRNGASGETDQPSKRRKRKSHA